MASVLQPKRIAALIAAYVVALQAILPFLMLPAFAAGADTTIICASALGSERSAPTTGHGAVCPSGAFCSMPGCCGVAPAPTPQQAYDPLLVTHIAVAATHPARFVVQSLQRKQAPRAPPSV